MKVAVFQLVFQIMLIVSMLGLGVINLMAHQWKVFGLGVLYAIANTIIFIL